MTFFVRPLALIGLLFSLLAAGPLRAYAYKGKGTVTAKLTIMSGGLTREYYVYVPNSYQPGKPVPLVFNLHGYTLDGLDQLTRGDLTDIADTANFLLVLPNGTIGQDPVNTQRCWNSFGTGSKVDDVGFISDLLDTLESQYSIDATRVYATGFSNGAFMSYRLACQLSNRIAAIASVSGAMVKSVYNDCSPPYPVPILDIHCTADQTIYYNGGFNGYTSDPNYYSTPTVLAHWVAINGCAATSDTTGSTKVVKRFVWSSGPHDSTVVHYKVIGGYHDWLNNSDINSSATVWHFLRQFRLASPYALTINRALNQPVRFSSSSEATLLGPNAVDGNIATRWSSNYTDKEWLYVDLGASYNVNEVKITWEAAYGKAYDLEVSADAITWTRLWRVTGNKELFNDWKNLTGTGRYVRMNGKTRGTKWGYSIFELEVYGLLVAAQQLPVAPKVLSSQMADAGGLTVFPNPATATPTVTLNGVAAFPAMASIYDMQGTLLHAAQLTQADDALDVSKLAKGLYMIRVSSQQTVQTVRLQKN